MVVTEDGSKYAGNLSIADQDRARQSPGTLSGPRFFGLIRKHASNGQLGSDATDRSVRRSWP